MELLNHLSIPRALSLFPTNEIEANCLSSDAVGNCVYITGPRIGGYYQVATADPHNGAVKMPAIGVVKTKLSPTLCKVQVTGLMEGVATGLTPGRVVFVSSTGTITHNIATPAVGQLAYIQSMGVAFSSDVVMIIPDFSIIKRVG